MIELIPTLIIGFLVGFALGINLCERTRHSNRTQDAHSADGGKDPVFTCRFHEEAFYEPENARKHAVYEHGAPPDGQDWEMTYPEGRE